MSQSSESLTAFSWGHEGWGNSTTELVAMVDAVEKSRGFGPPVFVDIRFRRQGRAVGFQEGAFQDLLGPERYHWIQGLGNRAVATGGQKTVIHRPDDADKLLDLIESAAAQGCRVIYFCHCASPTQLVPGVGCHRVDVGDLLLACARRRELPLTLEEWPGGWPIHSAPTEVDAAEFKKIARGAKTFRLPRGISLARAGAIPHLSLLHLGCEEGELLVSSGPAYFYGGEWRMPIHSRAPYGVQASFRREILTAHAEWGLTPRGEAPPPSSWETWQLQDPDGPEPDVVPADPASAPFPLWPEAVYAIRHPDELDRMVESPGPVTFVERKRWTGAARMVAGAGRDKRVAVLLADATDCSRLTHWGLLEKVELDGEKTRVTVSRTLPLEPGWTPQDLKLVSSGAHIAPGFIRSYALVRCPSVLE